MGEYILEANVGIMIHFRPYAMMAKFGREIRKEKDVRIDLENLSWRDGSGNKTGRRDSFSELCLMRIREEDRIKFTARGERPFDELKMLTELYAETICKLDPEKRQRI